MGRSEGGELHFIEERIDQWWSDLQKERRCNSTCFVSKIISKSSTEKKELARDQISKCLQQDIANSIQSKDISEMTTLCNAINGCFDNFTYAADAVNISFNECIDFINVCVNECINELFVKESSKYSMVKILDLLHSLSRILVLILKLRRPARCKELSFYLTEIKPCIKESLSKLSLKISNFLKVDEILMDTKCNFVMASLLMREIIFKEKEKLIKYHEMFLKELPDSMDGKQYKLYIYKFLLSNAIFNTWSNTVIDLRSTGLYLKFFIQMCERFSSDTTIILNISRALLLVIKNDCFKEFMINMKNQDFHLINSLLLCIYMLLDHPVACVRHSSKDFLKILVVYEEFKTAIFNSLPSLNIDKRSYFISLAALASETGSRGLLERDSALPDNLINALYDPTLVTHVVNTLDCFIVKDNLVEKDFMKWCEIWIVPLLVSLSKVPIAAAADIEKLVDGVFRRHSSAIFYIINKWSEPKNDEELRYVITALRIYHKHGFKKQKNIFLEVNLASNSNTETKFVEKKWKDLISEKLLRFCLHHNDDDTRVSAFSLIIQGLKSTEAYTYQDIKLIQYFLECNMNNQQPATRQKILSLIKKMIVRFSDSLVVLKRSRKTASCTEEISNHLSNYVSFQDWLIKFCFSNLFDGANFNRLNTSLSILLSCLENMENVKIDHSDLDVYWRKILVALRSTYEENKIMAVTIVKKLNMSKLLPDNKTIKFLFKKAYELSGKMEPPNVLTGSYLMQILMGFPSVKETVEEILSEDMSKVDLRLIYIRLLTKQLKDQVNSAEKNLMKAAVNGPMYGTLFAIRVTMKEIDSFNGVKDMKIVVPGELKNWSLILNEIIELSLRMVHVVSSVVNSSSPEGHLPSDFQSNFEFMLSEDGLKTILKGIDEAEDALSGKFLLQQIRNISLDVSKDLRTSEEIKNDCERLIRSFNRIFLSYNGASYFSHKIATDLAVLLENCKRLLSEINKCRDAESDWENFSECLRTIEIELTECIGNYEKYSCKKDRPTAQVLLLCAWRSVKEACLFLGDLVSKLPLEKILEFGLISEDVIIRIGEELRTLLCEIKHRGAFEQAYIGFNQLIIALWKCPKNSLNELPSKWLEGILEEIKLPLEKQKMKLCSSRRSAGLPFLIQAIIASELQCTNSAKIQTLEMTMNNLFAIVEKEEPSCSLESKIHSLNILRGLFKHALFGEHIAPYVSRGLMVAIRGSRDATWSIRNSSSLLFSSLVIRIFGVARNKDALSKKNRMTGRHFFQRYPELFDFFLNEMKLAFGNDLQSHIYYPQPHVFHVLLILGRLYPRPSEDPLSIDFSEFLPYLNISCQNATMKIRELGAKALVPLISPDKLKMELDQRFSFLKPDFIKTNSNHRHGVLLQIKMILSEMSCDNPKFVKECLDEMGKDWIENSNWILDIGKNHMPYLIKVSYAQILHLIFKAAPSVRKKIYELLKNKILVERNFSSDYEKNIPGRFAYIETLYFVTFDIFANLWIEFRDNDDFINFFISMLESEIDEVQALALRFIQILAAEECEENDDEDDSLTVRMKDLSCIQNESYMSAMKSEIFFAPRIVKKLTHCLISLFRNVKSSSFYHHKIIMRLKISVLSGLLLKNIISTEDVYDLCKKMESFSVMESLSGLTNSKDSDISVGAFICYAILFFENIKKNTVEPTSEIVSNFKKTLFNFSHSDADVKQRAGVSQVFNKYYYLFNNSLFRRNNSALGIWISPVRLICDEDPMVRKSTMGLVSKLQIYIRELNKKLFRQCEEISCAQLTTVPCKAQECLLDCYISLTDEEDLLDLVVQLVAWSVSSYVKTISYEHTTKQHEDGVFEKGNPNPFCEELIFAKLLCKKLEQLKTLTDVKSLFEKNLDSKHIDSLMEFFPTLVLPSFPKTLKEICREIVNILSEPDPEFDVIIPCTPFYVFEMKKAFDL